MKMRIIGAYSFNFSMPLIRDLISIKSAVKFYSFHHQVKKEKLLLIYDRNIF